MRLILPGSNRHRPIAVNDRSKPRTRPKPPPTTKPPRSTGPWPACRRAASMLSPNISVHVGMIPVKRPVDPATHDHSRRCRAQAEYNDGAAALAHLRLKNLRPLMYAGQGPVLRVIMRLGAWLCGGCEGFVPGKDRRNQIAVNDKSKLRTRSKPWPSTKPPRSTGPWPACIRAASMLSPNISLNVGMIPVKRPVDPATHDHSWQ